MSKKSNMQPTSQENGSQQPTSEEILNNFIKKGGFNIRLSIITIAVIAVIAVILVVLCCLPCIHERLIKLQSGAVVDINDKNVNISIYRGYALSIIWTITILSTMAICAITIIVYKIISVLRDLIENDQVKSHYNQ